MKDQSVQDDRAAVQRCREGDRDAYRWLVERYQNEALGHAMVLLRNRDDALDAVQEAFVDAYQALDRFDADRPFYPWLYVILRNRCYKLLGQRTRDAAVQSFQASSPSLLHSAESSEAAERVEQALLELEPEDREIITLRHLDGHSYAELAERLEIPLGTVMSRLYHARRRLRQKLD